MCAYRKLVCSSLSGVRAGRRSRSHPGPAASGARQRRLQRASPRHPPAKRGIPKGALSQRSHRPSACNRRRHHRDLRPPRAPRRHRRARDGADLRAPGSSARGPAARPRATRSRSSSAGRPSPAIAAASTSTDACSASASSTAATSMRRWCARATPGPSSNTRRATCRRKRRRARCTSASGKARPSRAWEFRAHRWAGAEQDAPKGCAIKGNVTAHGRIYHMPWSPWYGKIRIDEAKGKRWFCTEAEALAAGWRPAAVH